MEGNPDDGNHKNGCAGVGVRAQRIKTNRKVSSMKEASDNNTQKTMDSFMLRKNSGGK